MTLVLLVLVNLKHLCFFFFLPKVIYNSLLYNGV